MGVSKFRIEQKWLINTNVFLLLAITRYEIIIWLIETDF